MYEFFKIDDRILRAAEAAEQEAAPYFAKVAEVQRYNQEKMQAAFMQAGVSESHFVAISWNRCLPKPWGPRHPCSVRAFSPARTR